MDSAQATVVMDDEININVEIVASGPVGPQGPQGETGPAGVGVPSGGTTGQVLKKKSGTNYDTEWADESGGDGAVSSVNGQTGAVVLTASDVGAGTYSKPSGGIPKSDLSEAVGISLSKADSALQSYTETDPTVPSWAKAGSKPSYTASEVGAIAAPSSPTSGQFLKWNGSAWVASDLPVYSGGVS